MVSKYPQKIKLCQKKITTAKSLIAPGLIKEIGCSFYKEIHELVKWFNKSKELMINIDQTPLPFVLVSSYTMEKKGNQCVPVTGTTDYRQITGKFGVSLSGDFLSLPTKIFVSTWILCHANRESLGKWKHKSWSNQRSIGPVCLKSQAKIISSWRSAVAANCRCIQRPLDRCRRHRSETFQR